MHTKHGIHMLIILTHMIGMLMCTLVHIVDVRATLQSFVMIEYIIKNFQTNLFGLRRVLTPMDPRMFGYQNSFLFHLIRYGF